MKTLKEIFCPNIYFLQDSFVFWKILVLASASESFMKKILFFVKSSDYHCIYYNFLQESTEAPPCDGKARYVF